LVNTIYFISIIIAGLGMILLFIRLILGPGLVDRVVALDTLTIISVSLIVFYAFLSGRGIYLDVALVYALVSFLGVVALARYIEGGV